jgi:outer membrane protein assembly factor BamE
VEADALPSEAEFVASLDSGRKSGKVPVLELPAESLPPAVPPSQTLAPALAPPQPTSYPPLEPPAR